MGTYKTFHNIIRNLERKGFIQGYRDTFSRKKYLYATELGSEHISKTNYFIPHHNSIFHDTRVAELVDELSKYKRFAYFELEHEFKGARQTSYNSSGSYAPDALMEHFSKSGEVKMLGIELELTQKSASRIKTKYYNAINSQQVNYAIYFFPDEKIYKKYIDVFKDSYEEEYGPAFMFFWCPTLINGEMKLDDLVGYYNGSEKPLSSLLGERYMIKDELRKDSV